MHEKNMNFKSPYGVTILIKTDDFHVNYDEEKHRIQETKNET